MIRLWLICLLLLLSRSVAAWVGPNCERHTDDDHIALACNIYFEARNESYEGMMAVVAVTMNRVDAAMYPATVAEVVWQYKQFSWTHDGKVDRPKNRPSWEQAMGMAKRFTITRREYLARCPEVVATQRMYEILGRPIKQVQCDAYDAIKSIHVYLAQEEDPTNGSMYYHADYIELPYWADKKNLATQIDRHIFYTAARRTK